MDRKTTAFAFLILLLLILISRNRILDIIIRSSGFELKDGGGEVITLPAIEVPQIPTVKHKSALWRQSTGLMCSCDHTAFDAPVVIREIKIPSPPLPGYVYQQETVQQQAQQEMRTYFNFGMDSSFPIWGDRPYQKVWRGSDGRIFLKPLRTIWGTETPQKSWSNNFVGSDEYTMRDGIIYYGPYQYKFTSNDRYMAAT